MEKKTMNIEEVKRKYKDEWVLVEVIKEDSQGNPVKVRLLEHSKNRDDTYEAMNKYAKKYTYHFYNGKMPKDYAVAI